MKNKPIRMTILVSLAITALGISQVSAQETYNDDQPDMRGTTVSTWGPEAGDWEVTLGGSGSNDKDFDSGGFGLSGSWGYFTTDAFELSIRQSINYSNFRNSNLNGATRFAVDHHFLQDAFRPFLGVNAGGVYGESVEETLAAGLEGGMKWYVKDKTFVFSMVEYQWLFEDANEAEDQFNDGQFLYSVGIGFNY